MPRFHVQRSIQINASPEEVFNTVADFGTWTKWSPWLCSEPDAKVTVTASVTVPLPLIPAFARAVVPLEVPVSSTHVVSVDRFGAAP